MDQRLHAPAVGGDRHVSGAIGTAVYISQSATGDTVLYCGVDKIGALGNAHVRHV
jgi:hypothetical protein